MSGYCPDCGNTACVCDDIGMIDKDGYCNGEDALPADTRDEATRAAYKRWQALSGCEASTQNRWMWMAGYEFGQPHPADPPTFIHTGKGFAKRPAEPPEQVLDQIMDVIKSTPSNRRGYNCHGKPHAYDAPDYESIRVGVERVLGRAEPPLDSDRHLNWTDKALVMGPPHRSQPASTAGDVEARIEAALDDYEMRGDDGDYMPTEAEKFLIRDFCLGFMAEQHAPAAGEPYGGVKMCNCGVMRYPGRPHKCIGMEQPQPAEPQTAGGGDCVPRRYETRDAERLP